MKLVRYAAPALVLAALPAARAQAQSATQDVTLEVQAINQIAFTGSPSLTIASATAGSAPNSASANATYAITTNESDRKITAEIDSDTPSGLTLSVNLAAPSGATSAGAVQLSTTAQDVVTGISTVNASGLNVTYTLQATSAAGVVPSTSRTVTYTITAGA
jgi:opacity protein-like surface antigen